MLETQAYILGNARHLPCSLLVCYDMVLQSVLHRETKDHHARTFIQLLDSRGNCRDFDIPMAVCSDRFFFNAKWLCYSGYVKHCR